MAICIALVDADGMPIALKLTAGQAHDGRSAQDSSTPWAKVTSCSPTAPTTPMRCASGWRPAAAWANVRAMPNRKRRPLFSAFLYRSRNMVEQLFNRFKHFAVETRYDKRDDNFSLPSSSHQSASDCAIMSR